MLRRMEKASERYPKQARYVLKTKCCASVWCQQQAWAEGKGWPNMADGALGQPSRLLRAGCTSLNTHSSVFSAQYQNG